MNQEALLVFKAAAFSVLQEPSAGKVTLMKNLELKLYGIIR